MNIKKSALLGVTLAGSLSMSVSAFAGGYVGVSMGNTDFDAPEDGTSFEIKGGYALSDSFAIQASYVEFGDIDDNDPPVWTLESDAIELSVVGSYVISEKLNLTGLLGVAFWDISIDEAGFGSLGSIDGEDLVVGLGLSYSASDSVSLELQYKDYSISIEDEDLDVSNISAGVKFRF